MHNHVDVWITHTFVRLIVHIHPFWLSTTVDILWKTRFLIVIIIFATASKLLETQSVQSMIDAKSNQCLIVIFDLNAFRREIRD